MLGLAGLAEQGLKIVNKFVKDPTAVMKHELELKRLEADGDESKLQAYVSQLMGQIEINKIEAASSSLFKSGWRPAVGWVCALSFDYKFIIQQFLVLVILLVKPEFDISMLPVIEWTELSAVLFGMLGLSHHRSKDKNKGVTHV